MLHASERQRAIPLFALPDGGPTLTAGHFVRLDTSWQTADQVGSPAAPTDEIFNLVLDRGHVIEVDGAWCATLQHDVDERRGAMLMQALQRSRGWEAGCVEMDDLRVAMSELVWESKGQDR
eukprot:4782158-Prymnesium_polylepis.2